MQRFWIHHGVCLRILNLNARLVTPRCLAPESQRWYCFKWNTPCLYPSCRPGGFHDPELNPPIVSIPPPLK
jgi:hypothetical protein